MPHVACGTVLEALEVGGNCEWSPLVLGQGDGANRVVRAAVGEVDQNLLAGGSANESSSKGRAFTIGWVFLSARVIAPTIPRVLPPLTSTPRRSPCSQNLPVCSPGVKRGSSTCAADGASAAIGRRRCGVCLWRSCASGASGAQLAEGGTADSELLCDRGRGVSGDVYPWPQGCRSPGAMCSARNPTRRAARPLTLAELKLAQTR